MLNKMACVVVLGGLVGLLGCESQTTNIDRENDQGKAVMALDYRDFDQAASALVQSLIQSGRLKKADGSKYVITTGRIVNDTMQRIDTDQLMLKIEKELTNSGMAAFTGAVGGQGAPDEMVHQVRDLKQGSNADEFDPNTMPAKGKLIAPDLSISGKILQRNVPYSRGTQQVEYYFQLRLTEIARGLSFWQEEQIIGKRGDKRSTAW